MLARLQMQLLVHRPAVLLRGDLALGEHRLQHLLAPHERRRRVVQRVVDRRRLRQAGEQRRLRKRQVLRLLREVRLGGGLDAVGVVPVVDGVQVGLEDPRLRPLVAELDREAGLLDLAVERLLAARVHVPDELLADRRAALDHLAGADVGPERAQDPDVVDAAVLVEALVLDGDRRPRQPRRHLREADRLPVVVGRDRAEERAVGRVDERVRADVDGLQAREAARGRERDPGADAGDRDHDDEPAEDDGHEHTRAAAAALARDPLAPRASSAGRVPWAALRASFPLRAMPDSTPRRR